jgi:methylmalonyl-CoA carboxyltransferase 5S subunit
MGRYKVLTGEFADLMLGYYGETIGTRDPKIIELAKAQAKKPTIVNRPADLLKPEWEELRSAAIAIKGCDGSDEDVLTYAMFPQVASKFFGTRDKGPKNLGKDPVPATAPAAAAPSVLGAGALSGSVTYKVEMNGKAHKVTVSPA